MGEGKCNKRQALLPTLLILSTLILPAAGLYHWDIPAQPKVPSIPAQSQQSLVLSGPNALKETKGQSSLAGTVDVSTLHPTHTRQGKANSPKLFPDKGAPPRPGTGSGPGTLSTTSSSSIGISTVFGGIDATQECCNSPPDVQVAAGLNHVVEFVNIDGEIFTKQGIPITIFPLRSFFNISSSHSLADPRILFDFSSRRWFASMIDYARVGGQFSESRVVVAVSANMDPTGIWNLYSITGAFSQGPNPVFGITDQPILGISDNNLVISGNDFALANSGLVTFIGAQYWVINKADMIKGAPTISYATFGPDRKLFSVQPVRSLSHTTTQYMVTVGANTTRLCVACTPQVFLITGIPPGNVTVQAVPLPILPVPAPPAVLQPGLEENDVDVPDTRVTSAVWFKDSLWFAFSNGCTPRGDTQQRSCVRIVQIDTTTLTVRQSFDYGTKDTYHFYPALSIDSSGNMILVYGYSSLTTNPSVAVTGQASTDPVNSLAFSKNLVLGLAPDSSGRYGDYFGAATDPADRTLVWIGGEYIADQDSLCFFNCWSTMLGSASILGYGVSADPPVMTIQPGQSAKSSLTITSLNGFSGPVTFSASSTFPGLTPAVSPPRIRLNPRQTVQVTLVTSAQALASPGAYTVSIEASSGELIRSVNLKIIIPDFSLFTSSKSSSLPVGSSSSISTLTVGSSDGFQGAFDLSASTSPSTGLSCNLIPTTVTLNIAPSSTLHCHSTSSGTYRVTVTAAIGRLSKSVSITVTVSPFSISFDPTTILTQVGPSLASNVTLASLAGFSGLVNVSAIVSPSGPTVSLSPTSVLLDPRGTGSLALTISTASAQGGNYTVTVTGQAGTLSFSENITLIVEDYALAHSGAVLLFQGDEATFLVNIDRVNGFTGTVKLSASSVSTGLVCSIEPDSVTLGASASSTVTCAGATGSYLLRINGTTASISHSILVPVFVVDLSISTSSNTILVAEGSFSQITVTLRTLGFQGSLSSTLSATGLPQGATVDFSPNPLQVFSRSPATSFFTVGVDSTVPPGVFNLTLTGTAHGLSRSVPVSLRVLLSSIGFTQTQTFIGVNVNYSMAATVDTLGTNALTGTATFTASDSTSGKPMLSGALTIVLPINEEGLAFYVVEISTSPNWISLECRVDVAGNIPNCNLSRTLDINQDGKIDGLDLTLVSDAALCSQGSSCYDPALDLNADGTIDQYDLELVELYQGVTVLPPPLFVVSSDTPSVSFPVGLSGTSTINLVSLNGFSETVALSVTSSPGLNCSLSSTLVTLDDAETVQLICTSPVNGVYNATVVGTSGIISKSITIIAQAIPFNISAGSEPIVVQAGSSFASNITLASLAGFSGVVNLSAKVSPGGPTVSLSRANVVIDPGGQTSVTLTLSSVSVPAGNYTLALTGETGTLSLSTIRLIRVVDFRLSGLFPTSIPVGSSYSQTITVTGVNGFTGPVTLTVAVSPSGFTCSIGNVIVEPGSSPTSIVNCTQATGGSYRVIVSGVAGPATHSVSAIVDVFDYLMKRGAASEVIERSSFGTTNVEIDVNNQYPTFSSILLGVDDSQGISLIFSGVGTGNTFGNGVARFGFFTSRNETVSITIVVDSSVSVGTHTVTVTAFGSRVIHSITISVIVPDFQLTTSRAAFKFKAGSTGISVITITSLNGFTGNLALTLTTSRQNLVCSLNPNTASLSNNMATSILLCRGSPGRYLLTLTGSGASISHSISMRVAVTG